MGPRLSRLGDLGVALALALALGNSDSFTSLGVQHLHSTRRASVRDFRLTAGKLAAKVNSSISTSISTLTTGAYTQC